jgi:outer membrane protein TolC
LVRLAFAGFRYVVAGGMALAVLAGADRPDIPAVLPLRRAVSIALAQSTSLRAAQWRLKQAEARADQARAPLLPQVSVGAYQADQTVNLRAMGIDIPFLPSKVGPFPSMDLRGTVTQDLFNMQSMRNRKAAAQRTVTSERQAQNAREAVVLAVVGAYLQALRSKASQDTTREQLQLAQRLYELTRDREQQGVSSTLDTNRARQQVNSLQQALVEAENNLTAAKLQLANVIHARVTAAFDLEELGNQYATGPVDRQEAVRTALEARPDYRAAESHVRAAELQLKAIRASRLPVVQFKGDFGQSGRTPFENLSTFRVLGSVNVPLFTGGRIAGQVAEAQGQLEEARVSLEEIESQVETDVLTALAAVDAAARELKVAEENVRLAKEEVDLATARLTSGVADNTEVVNAQDRLSRAEDTRIRAFYGLQTARANLERATGAAEKTYSK